MKHNLHSYEAGCFALDGDFKGTAHPRNSNVVASVYLHADGESDEDSSLSNHFWSLTAK